MTPAVILPILMASVVFGADIIDRIAVSIENGVITESEVTRQIRITAFLNNEEPDLSPASKRDTAERLVDQALIRREIVTSGYIPVAEEQSTAAYKAFRTRLPSEAAYQEKLARYHLKDSDLMEAFRWQTTFLEFVDIRFRSGITISEEEIRQYYDDNIKGKGSPEASPPFEEARERVEQILAQQRIDNALDRWLGQTRTQTRIRYRQDALQ